MENYINTNSLSITQGDTMTQISFRADINEYTSRVLGVVKEKYGLRSKSEALDKFAEMFGEKFVELEIREEIIEEVVRKHAAHLKKYPHRKMTLQELHKLLGKKNV